MSKRVQRAVWGSLGRGSGALSACILSLITLLSCGKHKQEKIVVGSKNFTEQIVLAELFAEEIEARAGLPVERKVDLGGTLLCHDALVSGKIDLYPEYTGTALLAVLKDPIEKDPEKVLARVQSEYRSRFAVEVLPPLGFNNSFAMVVRGEEAARLRLRTVSDIVPYAPKWRAGFGYEFIERPDGYHGWAAAYGIHFASEPKVLDLGLLYRALEDKKVEIVAGNSTDGVIESLHMAVLEDDRHYFPPYEAVPLVRSSTLQKYPEVRTAIGALAGKISENEMRQMNFEVDGQHREVADVVRQFRATKGL